MNFLLFQFKSTLICPDCEKVSITFDPFMSMSVPLPEYERTENFIFYLILRDLSQGPYKLSIPLSPKFKIKEVLEQACRQVDFPLNHQDLELCIVRD